MHVNIVSMIPDQYIQVIGIQKLESVNFSVCCLYYTKQSVYWKNMTLCGLPAPKKIKKWVQKFLEDMTEELLEEESSRRIKIRGE